MLLHLAEVCFRPFWLSAAWGRETWPSGIGSPWPPLGTGIRDAAG